MVRPTLLVALALAALGGPAAGCHRASSDAARRESDQATAEAEERAQEATLTSASLEPTDEARDASQRGPEAQRARSEMEAAFRLEQSDYRGRLQHALDLLDGEMARPHRNGDAHGTRATDLRARRALLKSDLAAVDRSTEQDWATLRTKVERDVESGKPGAQLPPRVDRVPGETP